MNRMRKIVRVGTILGSWRKSPGTGHRVRLINNYGIDQAVNYTVALAA